MGRLSPSEDDEDENANESAAHTHVVDLQLLHEKLARSLATGRESEFDQRMTRRPAGKQLQSSTKIERR